LKSGNPAARLRPPTRPPPTPCSNAALINKHEYLAIRETGELDSALEPEEAEILNISAENEAMRQGQNPPVIALDQHSLHISHHKGAIGRPDSRSDPRVVQAVWITSSSTSTPSRVVDPQLLNAIRRDPDGSPAQTPPPGPEASRATPPPMAGGPPGMTPPMPPTASAAQHPGGLPQQTEPPENPMTGQTWTPTDARSSPKESACQTPP